MSDNLSAEMRKVKELATALRNGKTIRNADGNWRIEPSIKKSWSEKVYRYYAFGDLIEEFSSSLMAVAMVRKVFKIDAWEIEEQNEEIKPVSIKIVIDQSVTESIEQNAYAHKAFHDWRLHENLRPMFEELKRKEHSSIFHVMRSIDMSMMLYASLNISFVISVHHEHTWLIYSTNDIFTPWQGFTGLFLTIKPFEYYEDGEAVISFNHSRSKVKK